MDHRRRLLVLLLVGVALVVGVVVAVVAVADTDGSDAPRVSPATEAVESTTMPPTTSTLSPASFCTHPVCRETTPSRHPINSVDILDDTHITLSVGCSWSPPAES
jgi:hypothetical protein